MSNGNPFYVQPGANYGPGLQQLAGTLMQAKQMRQLGQQRKQKELQQDYVNSMFDAVNNPEQIPTIAKNLKARLSQAGAPPQQVNQIDRFIELYNQNPDEAVSRIEKQLAFSAPKRFQAMQQVGRGSMPPVPAEIQTFEFLTSGLTGDEKTAARRIKLGLSPRATESAEQRAMKRFSEETAKLQARLGLEPEVAGAVTAAKNEAVARVKESGKVKSNETAWNVYNESMSNLAQAMAGTRTGPIAGFIPAVTSNAQIAEGAVAVMAPVLKQMFRTAGEGTFTDRDQEMLIKMVPTRKDLPAARAAKIQAIDTIVRAKLDKPLGFQRGEAAGRQMQQPNAPVVEQAQTPAQTTTVEQFEQIPLEQQLRQFVETP
jgi:hypothetical protein